MNKSVRLIIAGVFAGVAVLIGGNGLQAQVQIESSATKIDFGGRVQLQGTTSSCSDYTTGGDSDSACSEDVPGFDTFIRRVRLAVDIQFNDWISAKIQPEFGKVDEFRLADAYGRLDLAPDAETSHARITLGHFKRPFDIFTLTSSTQTLTIERAMLVGGLSATSLGAITAGNRWADRDIGVMVDGGTPGDRLHYWFGVFNGGSSSENADAGGKQYVGRAQVNLATGELPFSVGVAGTVNNRPFTRADESLATKGYGGWEVFAEVGDFGGGPHVQAAVIGGKNSLQNPAGDTPDLPAGDEFADLITWQAIGAWKFDVENFWIEAIEPVFRVTRTNPNTDLEKVSVWGFTPGLQVFLDGRNKFVVNWDFISFDDDRRAENSLKVQYQFYF